MTPHHCPICKGSLASWVVRREFKCHHCSWAISANVGVAFRKALAVGACAELIVLLCLWLWLGNLMAVLAVWLYAGFFVGAVVGGFTYWCTLVLTPLRPQRPLPGALTGRSAVLDQVDTNTT